MRSSKQGRLYSVIFCKNCYIVVPVHATQLLIVATKLTILLSLNVVKTYCYVQSLCCYIATSTFALLTHRVCIQTFIPSNRQLVSFYLLCETPQEQEKNFVGHLPADKQQIWQSYLQLVASYLCCYYFESQLAFQACLSFASHC